MTKDGLPAVLLMGSGRHQRTETLAKETVCNVSAKRMPLVPGVDRFFLLLAVHQLTHFQNYFLLWYW